MSNKIESQIEEHIEEIKNSEGYNNGDTFEERKEGTIFEPKEVVWIIHNSFAEIFNHKKGYLIGSLYAGVTILAYFMLVLILTYLMAFTEFRYSFELAALSMTIGTSMFLIGSSMSKHWKKEDLNLRAFIHNAITFIVTGILVWSSFAVKEFFSRQSIIYFFDQTVIILLSAFSSITFFTSIWVLLKLMWRMQQIVSTPKENWRYGKRQSPYSELRASFSGFLQGLIAGPWWLNLAAIVSAILIILNFLF